MALKVSAVIPAQLHLFIVKIGCIIMMNSKRNELKK